MYDTNHRISQLPLITMAIITGGAIGGGSELITAFDFVCMSKESGFIHFVQTRMGVSSPWGGMNRLKNNVGRKTALRWMAGGFKIKAEQGYQAGFVDLVVGKDADCLKESLNFLKPFLVDERTQENVAPNAVRGMKKLSFKRDSDWDYDSKVFSSTVFSKL
jgi:enoyl-CoA hydratase/carnithine racemase